MKRLIYAVLLFFLLNTIATACDITNLTLQEDQNKNQTEDKGNKDNSSNVFQNQNNSSDEEVREKTFKDLVKINPDINYEAASSTGYYSIGPLKGHIINIKWDTAKSVNFRIKSEDSDIISKCVIDEETVKASTLIEAPANGIYISDSLRDGKGLVFISWMKEKNFYLYRNNELKEYKDIQYYFLSPLQKYIILFPGDYKTKPILMDLTSGNEIKLPIEADHGWPEYTAGISFSADETKLMYEDWSKMELCIYDIKGQKELSRISEKGYSLFEGVFSPNGKMAAYLKFDNSKEAMDWHGGRNPIGHKLVVYDLDKKKILKEIPGEEFVYLKPIWSPDSKYLAFNMVQIKNKNELGEQLYGNPFLLNISTGKTTKLANNEDGIKYAAAWSENSRRLMAALKSRDALNRFSAIDIKLGDELNIDSDKYYISRGIKEGTSIYEIISNDNSKLEQFKEKKNVSLSQDEKYIAFESIIAGNEYLIIAPIQSTKQ